MMIPVLGGRMRLAGCTFRDDDDDDDWAISVVVGIKSTGRGRRSWMTC
jgi:hypothetical protein